MASPFHSQYLIDWQVKLTWFSISLLGGVVSVILIDVFSERRSESIFEYLAFSVSIGVAIFFIAMVVGSVIKSTADKNHRVCSNCLEKVSVSDVLQTISFHVIAVTDTQQAVTTNNSISTLTVSGGRASPTLGNYQTTSFVPIKIGRVRITVSCPHCHSSFQWIEHRQVNVWNEANGNVSYAVLGDTSLPL